MWRWSEVTAEDSFGPYRIEALLGRGGMCAEDDGPTLTMLGGLLLREPGVGNVQANSRSAPRT